MSGGSLEYCFYKVDVAVEVIERRAKTVLQKAFAAHLRDVSKALHDLEWVFSGDYGEGDEIEALSKIVNKKMELEVATNDAKIALKQLQDALSAQDA